MRTTLNSMSSRRQGGFTLVETMVTTAIVAVLASAGVPGMKSFLVNRAAVSQMTDLTSALRFARSEAFKRGQEVTVCARDASSTDTAPACVQAGQNWSAGWIVFVDFGQRGRVDDNDRVLRLHQSPGVAGQITSAQRSITFQFNGISLKGNTTVRFSPPGATPGEVDAEGTQVVCVNKPGRARMLAAASCGA